MARYGMVLDPLRCVDCRACMIACTAENGVPIGKHRNWVAAQQKGRFPELSLRMLPGQCMQCDNPPCVRSCPTRASYIDEPSGIVLIDADKCIGCRYCMESCPYDARYFDEESGVVDKCTFCVHRLTGGREPACVETCPTKVRVVGDLADAEAEVARLRRTHATEQMKLQAGTGPNLHYIIR